MEINRCVDGKAPGNFDSYTDVNDGAVGECELGHIEVYPVALIFATARCGALAGELAHDVALLLICLL